MQENQAKVVSITSVKSKVEEENRLASMLLDCESAQICSKCFDIKAISTENHKEDSTIVNHQDLQSGSTLLSCPSAHLCPNCKDNKAIMKEEAALDDSEQEEILRGTESTDTIVAYPQDLQTDDQNKFIFVSDLLNNMATEIKSIESIHELKPKKEEKLSVEARNSRPSSTLENGLRSSETKRLSYFDDEGFKRYDLTIVTSLTDLDTLKEKTSDDSPRVSFTFKEPSMNLIKSKRQSWRSVRRSSGSFLSRVSNAFRKSNQ
ncbi:unnamed protein product [Chironomus riparius]|uniref:Uncharacterized protein n=1 Tax=Chironomus riparius TaxID=315576 RepID=A0A9N9WVC4_9DIPT|nr:unnamed protein product [Chironomus riparius]